jgi:hypothetical protein
MFSSKSIIIFGVIVLIAVIVIWKWWKKPSKSDKKNEEIMDEARSELEKKEEMRPPESEYGKEPPPMVFAVNDNGYFDLTDMSGKVLNISFGSNPKVYANLLDQSEKDIAKDESTGQMSSKVGTTKSYRVGDKSYIVNFTRLE